MDRNIDRKNYDDVAEGRSLRGNVDRNWLQHIHTIDFRCRSLRGNVDRNRTSISRANEIPSRSLRGNVDRNTEDGATVRSVSKVVPYVGTWIEMPILEKTGQ